MTIEEAIANLNMISVAFVEPVTKEQRKLIDDTFDMAIKALEQEPKTGHWIDISGIYAECSNCNEEIYITGDFKYCPNCGCRMVESIESEEI